MGGRNLNRLLSVITVPLYLEKSMLRIDRMLLSCFILIDASFVFRHYIYLDIAEARSCFNSLKITSWLATIGMALINMKGTLSSSIGTGSGFEDDSPIITVA
eukprot:Gregarina_sp_Poly_1__3934@NODE_2180_length_2542_cov_105_294949_g1405_i0_p3_GENE_NODE_2180_length_2542_cov_105_294949_g1405_i0NODE_2180_length_2542_cov_105_294949_g1405_i0_p3_ORF_typecomplete_len102_score5_32_NODE_2180_length_2542_cov_105_294949_g1405_i012261531